MKHLHALLMLCIIASGTLMAQVDLNYQKPPTEILELADAPAAPSVRINSKGDQIVLLYRSQYKSLAELSETELRLGGLRINPITNIGSRTRYRTNIKLMKVGTKNEIQAKGLPANPRLAYFSWSPDDSKMAFTNTTSKGVELWVLDIANATCTKLSDANLNANLGQPFSWFRDSKALLMQVLPESRKALINKTDNVPSGPTISVNNGKKAQNRTYQDLLKDKADEFNFEQLAMADLYKVSLDGNKKKWMDTDIYDYISFSPDGKYVMINTVQKPYSYLVPYYKFPSVTKIYDANGTFVKTMLEVPLIEDLPQGFMAVRKGMRRLSWRSDKPSSLVWCEALDEGDPAKEVEFRDEVFTLDAPFTAKPISILKTINRYSGITWGDKKIAVAYDYWWNTRNTKTYIFNPSNAKQKPEVISDRNYQDRYSDPGNFVTKENEFNRYVLDMDKGNLFRLGAGYSKEGKKPFVDQFNIKTKKIKRLWQAENKDKLESVLYAINMKKGLILTSIESRNEYPNYCIRNVKKGTKPEKITFFENPFKSISNVHKEVIKYKREDGVELSATLYLPPNYDKNKKEKLPMIMWAYPTEFKDKASAGQVTASSNEFTYPWYGSPVFWLTRGYVVLDDASFPIVGEGKEEPNDSFIKQLVANAKAAIDAVDEMGYIDRNKVAVGGHSYGAFMTANLLTHSNLFAAGIARSGAYNRTLTPFGFQSEERNYWEAPNIYYNMSPFMHCDKMKSPLLLIHGAADNNSGTYPMQSERYFNALKGLGATVRLVMLPKESHGYAAKESILHMLWEQDQWLEKHVKNRVKKDDLSTK